MDAPSLDAALDTLRAGHVDHGDVRWVRRRRQWLVVRDGRPLGLLDEVDEGVGVRAVTAGGWGYAATASRHPDALRAAARMAIELAGASRKAGFGPLRLPLGEPQQGTWASPCGVDPFGVPLGERLALLQRAEARARAHPEIVSARAGALLLRIRTRLCDVRGTDVEQTFTLCGAGVRAVAARDGVVQQRSYPKDHEGDVRQAGWEFVESLALEEHAERVREEAIALTLAPPCPAETQTVILDGSQLSLQVHESCGHPAELDRVLGEEVSLAGESFLQPELLGSFEYGSPIVNLVADPTTPGGPGTLRWDDEGTLAQPRAIVRNGRFVGYLSGLRSAAQLGVDSMGACRAASWDAVPIVRMVNVNLLPGEAGTLEDLVADTREGVLLSTNKSWSIDQRRLDFQFGCEVAWEIRRGRRTRMLRDPVYGGRTPEFWRGCDAICGPSAWRMWGYLFCGKGDPMQLLHVGHGVAPARFRGVRVGASS